MFLFNKKCCTDRPPWVPPWPGWTAPWWWAPCSRWAPTWRSWRPAWGLRWRSARAPWGCWGAGSCSWGEGRTPGCQCAAPPKIASFQCRHFQPISIRDSNQIFQNICPTTMCLFSSFNCMHCTNAYICENVINRAEPEPDFFLSMKCPLMTR